MEYLYIIKYTDLYLRVRSRYVVIPLTEIRRRMQNWNTEKHTQRETSATAADIRLVLLINGSVP